MQVRSFDEDISHGDKKVKVSLILESSFSKELRIVLRKGQVMNEHKAPFPIVVHILEGAIDFGVHGSVHTLSRNSILTLDGNIPHDLVALEDSIVRLTLSKSDQLERVKQVALQTPED